MHRLAVALASVLLLSGCTGTPESPSVASEGMGAPGAAEPAQVAYIEAELATLDISASALQPASFQLTIPEGARNLTVEGWYTAATTVGIDIEVDGCGAGSYDSLIGAGAMSGFDPIALCGEPAPGQAAGSFSVQGAYQGNITFRAMVPGSPERTA